MTRRWLLRSLLAAVTLPIFVWVWDRCQVIHWVGSTDLEIEFVVTDAATGEPVDGAHVEITSAGGFYRDREPQEFVLVVDGDGTARSVCHDSMCFGTRSQLRFTDTFAVHLPRWSFRVTAPGYATRESEHLDELEYRRRTKEDGPRRAKLVVPVSLTKQPANPN